MGSGVSASSFCGCDRSLLCNDTLPGRSLPDAPAVGSSAGADVEVPTSWLVFVERPNLWRHDDVEKEGGAKQRQISGGCSVKPMSVFYVECPPEAELMPPNRLDKAKVASFREVLECHGIDTSAWGASGNKSIESLYWEAYEQRGCVITGVNRIGKLKRVTRLVKIGLIAEVFGVEHTLVSWMHFMHDGQHMERKQVPLRKLLWTGQPSEDSEGGDPLVAAENCPYTEHWETSCRKVLEQRLGLSLAWQQQHLEQDMHGYAYRIEDNLDSAGYPGLQTLYCIHEVTYRVVDPDHPAVRCIGLPLGCEFATWEGAFRLAEDTGAAGRNGIPDTSGSDMAPIGSQMNVWVWDRAVPPPTAPLVSPKAEAKSVPAATTAATPTAAVSGAQPPASDNAGAAQPGRGFTSMASRLGNIKRVPLPASCALTLAGLQAMEVGSTSTFKAPNTMLWKALDNRRADWARIRRIAKRISDPTYSLSQFCDDLTAFPELNLYLLEAEDEQPASVDISKQMSSGRTSGDEYQRTVGAFFAIYWLLRLDHDGKDGFSFGVDDDWVPVREGSGADEKRMYPADKRLAFRRDSRWEYFGRLLLEAGLISGGANPAVNERRMVSLLVLTAIHDIMKMEVLLPTVEAAHAPYHGYAAGDTIGDHDHALAYLMEHFPHLLPSFCGLEPEEQQFVLFTQCKLCFNHGWFVQAEAPPGAIFSLFKEAVGRGKKTRFGSCHVAFYFVHWLTDLAGAEPTPLGGCEKFVIKFPLPVLNSFLRSFEFVERVPDHTETEVVEEYLKIRWAEHTPGLGPCPTGPSAIATMRLLCMAQMNAAVVLKDWHSIADADAEVLAAEMARSGCAGQSFSEPLVPPEVHSQPVGPAFLIYYGPAFLQNLGNDRPARRLTILAEVYRCARVLWPASDAQASANVSVRIDAIKALSSQDIMEAKRSGDLWVMVKHNESEAFIRRHTRRTLNPLLATRQSVQILDLGSLRGVL